LEKYSSAFFFAEEWQRPDQNRGKFMRPRLAIALCCFAILAILAAATLEGIFRMGVWLLLGALAVKTWIASIRERG
jgi:hypothetical protein